MSFTGERRQESRSKRGRYNDENDVVGVMRPKECRSDGSWKRQETYFLSGLLKEHNFTDTMILAL